MSMRFSFYVPLLCLCLIFTDSYGQKPSEIRYVSVEGRILKNGNPVDNLGNLKVNTPLIRLFHAGAGHAKGTVLLLTGNDYKTIEKKAGERAAAFLIKENLDVALLEYRVSGNTSTRDSAITDASKAYQLLQANRLKYGLRGSRLIVLGYAAGGHLANKVMQTLEDQKQPNDLILLSPQYLNERLPGTVYPAILPPLKPIPRLLCIADGTDVKPGTFGTEEFAKLWKGYDGQSWFHKVPSTEITKIFDQDPKRSNKASQLLRLYLDGVPAKQPVMPNSAIIPVPGDASERHQEKLELVKKEKFNLIMLGNSITNNLEKPEYQPQSNQFFAQRHALNLGYSGYRTENIIWNIENGELEGQAPKVVVLEIGTNNVDEKNYPVRHTAGQLAEGILTIVKKVREKSPDSKIVILRCFPGAYSGPTPTSHRLILERASEIVSKIADGKSVFYADLNHVFLNMDGSVNKAMMPDWLHPSPEATHRWLKALDPLLAQLLGDNLKDTLPANSAVNPVSKLEEDSYDWWARHAEVLAVKDSINPEIVLIGNSITHFWGGEPAVRNRDGSLRKPNGPIAYNALFQNRKVLNLGFGYDRTQNVLWRLDHGEVNGLHPKTVILNIGTNNTSQTANARMNTAAEIVEGIKAICLRLRSKLPRAKIVLMAILPREQSPTHPRRKLIREVNKGLAEFARLNQISFVDVGPKFLMADGTMLPDVTSDWCHPNEKGYQFFVEGLRPFVSEP
jgi:lysophospholipase L1-like esterase